MCKDLERRVLLSSAFQRCFPGQLASLDHHVMPGVDTPREIFTLTETFRPGFEHEVQGCDNGSSPLESKPLHALLSRRNAHVAASANQSFEAKVAL
jgi:hypothetical protein